MKYRIRICQAPVCEGFGSGDLFKDALKKTEGSPHIAVEKRFCMGLCGTAPNVQVTDGEGREVARYSKVTPNQLLEILEGLH